ncbi:16256_t:CDS:2, partial [Rhizophagus irregularis]
KEINHHLKPVPDSDPGFINSKSSHADHVYDLWQHRWKNDMFSNRLGIRYKVGLVANSSNFIRKHSGAYIYRKHLSDFELNLSNNPATKRKQETRFKRHCRRVFKNINPTSRTIKEDKLAAGRRYRFLFYESQHIYSPIHHLKFKRFPKEKLLPDLNDYTFKIPHHALENSSITPIARSQASTSYRPSGANTIPHYLNAEEIAALGTFLEPLRQTPIYYGHNPVDPSKVDNYDSSAANAMGTTLKHYYRRALSTRQLTVWTEDYHMYMKQPSPPPMPSKKKQRNKWKKWMDKYQDYNDFISKPYAPRPYQSAAYHRDLFGSLSHTSDDTKSVEYRPNKRDTVSYPSASSQSHDHKRPRPANSYLSDSLFSSLNSN